MALGNMSHTQETRMNKDQNVTALCWFKLAASSEGENVESDLIAGWFWNLISSCKWLDRTDVANMSAEPC